MISLYSAGEHHLTVLEYLMQEPGSSTISREDAIKSLKKAQDDLQAAFSVFRIKPAVPDEERSDDLP